MDMMPGVLVERWQAAYRAYNAAGGGRAELARLSANVAAVWREMAGSPGLDWGGVAGSPDFEWCLMAAFTAAAEAFEYQAQDWGRGSRCGVPGRPTERRTGARHGAEPSGDGAGSRVSGSVK